MGMGLVLKRKAGQRIICQVNQDVFKNPDKTGRFEIIIDGIYNDPFTGGQRVSVRLHDPEQNVHFQREEIAGRPARPVIL
jgi:hypothetical protein